MRPRAGDQIGACIAANNMPVPIMRQAIALGSDGGWCLVPANPLRVSRTNADVRVDTKARNTNRQHHRRATIRSQRQGFRGFFVAHFVAHLMGLPNSAVIRYGFRDTSRIIIPWSAVQIRPPLPSLSLPYPLLRLRWRWPIRASVAARNAMALPGSGMAACAVFVTGAPVVDSTSPVRV